MNDDSRELFDRLGGTEVLTSVVRVMYDHILADPELAHFFENIDVERVRKMQFEFLSSAFDGPVNYSGAELNAIHRNRGIRTQHFTRFCTHFTESAKEHGISDREIDNALGRLAMYKDKITGDVNVDG